LWESVTEIGRAAERAAALTRQLLAISRQQVLEFQVLDLNAVVAKAEKMLHRLIGEDVQLTTRLRPDLSPVWADPGQIDQVLLNLAVNARDAMPKGGTLSFDTRNIEIDPTDCSTHPELHPGRYVLMAVTDTGCGMTPEIQARIFEPFFTTKDVGQGTGLGLSVVHGIVEQCGGHVEVSSVPERGTMFEIYLPGVEAPAERVPAKLPQGRGETVLLVEDETPVRNITLLLLEKLGYRVLEAANAEEAFSLVESGQAKIELLLTDVIMPGTSGPELAAALSSRDLGLKVLFQSGYTGEAVLRHANIKPDMAFLKKPFTLGTLAKKFREVLDL
jgi:two-component system cell cycle sensor histidine kinase/response regulator CckA